jgi:hypothetical protein
MTKLLWLFQKLLIRLFRNPNLPVERSQKKHDRLTAWESEKLAELICPDCEKKETLLSGPCGGASQNTLCENCHSEFNISLICPRAFDRNASKETLCLGERISDRGQGRKAIYGIK